MALKAAGVHERRKRKLIEARDRRGVQRKTLAVARHERIRQHEIANAQARRKAFREGVDVNDAALAVKLAQRRDRA